MIIRKILACFKNSPVKLKKGIQFEINDRGYNCAVDNLPHNVLIFYNAAKIPANGYPDNID